MGKVGGIVTGFIIVLLVIGGFMCTEKIPAGYVGVVYNMNGGVKVTEYSIALEPSYMTADD